MIETILTTIVPALLPAAADAIKLGVRKLTGASEKPATMEERIELEKLDIEKLKALATLDAPGGQPSQWVIDLRASSRYLAVYLIMLNFYAVIYTGQSLDIIQLSAQLASSAFFFLFGDRVYLHLKQSR